MRIKSCNNVFNFLLGVALGIIFTFTLSNFILTSSIVNYKGNVFDKNSFSIIFTEDETYLNPEFIFIGVIIKENYLEKIIAINKTWGKNIKGSIKFFVDQNDAKDINGFTEFSVELVNNLKTNSFESLIEIYDSMSNDSKIPYNFYMLTTSDTYIQTENLQRFIKTVNSSQLVTQTLFSHFPSNIFRRKRFDVVCIDENTFIISRDALLLFRSVFDQCRSGSSFYWIFYNMDWQTCFRQVLGIPCSVPEKAQNLIFKDEKQNFSLLHSGYGKQFKNVAFFSPVEVQSMFYLHGYFKSLEIKNLETEILNFQREKFSLLQQSEIREDILSNSSFISDDYLDGFFVEHLGSDLTSQDKLNCGFKTKFLEANGNYKTKFLEANGNSREIFEESNAKLWNLLSPDDNEDFLINIQKNFHLRKTSLYVKNIMLNHLNEQGKELKGSNVTFTLFRQCPSYGMQFTFGISENLSKGTNNLVTYQVPFGPLWVRETPQKNYSEVKEILIFDEFKHYLDDIDVPKGVGDLPDGGGEIPTGERDTERIEMILALSGRSRIFERFMVNYELEVLRRKRNVGLTVSLYGPKDEERKTNARMVSWYKEQYPEAPLFYIQGDTLNSKSKALALAASDFNDDSLLFIIDVDMVFNAEIFDRIRWFTIPGKQVYFPIVFSEYSPNMSREKNVGSEYDHFQYEEPFGLWREYGWGMVSIYQFDLVNVGGYDTTIVGWGVEDVDFSDKVINSMKVIRVPEPGLVHVYHDKNCHDIVERKAIKERGNSCANSASSVFASSSKIAKSLDSNKDIVNYYKRFHLRKKNRNLVLKKRREKIATRIKKKKKSNPKISRF